MDEREKKVKKQKFELLMEELKLDSESWQVYTSSLVGYEAKLQHEEARWKRAQWDEATAAVSAWTKNHLTITCWSPSRDSAAVLLTELASQRVHAEKKLQMPPESMVPVALLNACSLSMIKSEQQSAGYKVAGNLVSTYRLGLGVVLLPVFSYKKGNIFMEEHQVLKALSSFGTLNLDRRFSVKFTKRCAAWLL